MTFEQYTTVAERPVAFENHLHHKSMSLEVRYDLRPVAEGEATELTATQQVRLKSFMLKAVEGLIRQQIDKTMPADLKRLAALVESQDR